MKDAKLQFSIKLPKGYNTVLAKGRQYLMEHPDLIGKYAGKIVFVSDVFQWGLDMIADHLDIEFKNNGDLEMVENPRMLGQTPEEKLLERLDTDKVFKAREYEATKRMTSEMYVEYDRDYKVKGISLTEYLTVKESGL